jgi:hypothetical protein
VTARLPRAVLALTAILLIVATVLTLDRHASRVVGTNGVSPAVFALSVPAGERACQPILPVPSRASKVRMTLGAYHRSGARVQLELPGAPGSASVPVREGINELPAPPGGLSGRELCIVNVGRGRVALAGAVTGRSAGATVGDRRVDGVFSALYLSADSQTWRERVGGVLDRVGYAKGLPGGSWTGALLVAMLVLTLGGALASGWRYLRS